VAVPGSRHNSRWLAHCYAIRQDPDCEWDGKVGMEFTLWIQKHARDFTQQVCPGCTEGCGPNVYPEEFTSYLWKQARTERLGHVRVPDLR
jgi:hypothetical protein